jgi:hypothetical protein
MLAIQAPMEACPLGSVSQIKIFPTIPEIMLAQVYFQLRLLSFQNGFRQAFEAL